MDHVLNSCILGYLQAECATLAGTHRVAEHQDIHLLRRFPLRHYALLLRLVLVIPTPVLVLAKFARALVGPLLCLDCFLLFLLQLLFCPHSRLVAFLLARFVAVHFLLHGLLWCFRLRRLGDVWKCGLGLGEWLLRYTEYGRVRGSGCGLADQGRIAFEVREEGSRRN